MTENTEQQYLNSIFNFKKVVSLTIQDLIPKHPKIATPYLNTILTYLINLAELSNEFAQQQKDNMLPSSFIVSRSIFEECAILNRLIKENKYGENSYFYKYLYIQDMHQDVIINSGWNNEANDYWRRIHNLLHLHFSSELQEIEIQPFPENSDCFKGYTKNEKCELTKIVNNLSKDKKYKEYTKSKNCSVLFEDVYSKTDLIKFDTNHKVKNDIRIIYGQLCHYSHSSLTAIEDFNITIKDGVSMFCFIPDVNNKIININKVILQWMKYTLEYILEIFSAYCKELQTE